MEVMTATRQPFYPKLFSLMFIITVASIVIMSWVWFAGPNSDTILTYHRNHLTHHWTDILHILAGQDQAPLPQLFHYSLHLLGFSSVIALQISSSLIIVLALLYILANDLNIDPQYKKLSHPLWLYTFSAIAMIISPSFSAALTWVRYAVIIGVLWYGVWVLEEHISKSKHPNNYAFGLGIILSLGFLVSYTWGAVVVATILSLFASRQLKKPQVFLNLLFGVIPGLIFTVSWLIYAGSEHLDLILLRTQGTSFNLVKLIGKALLLLTYPWMGGIFIPSITTLLITTMTVSILGYGIYLYYRNEPTRRLPFFIHFFLPIPLFLITNVTSGYGMVGPGLILISCAIKGMIGLPRHSMRYAMSLMLTTLLIGMLVNLNGKNVFSASFQANKSREAIQTIVAHLASENALNNHTLVVAGDESSRVLIESIPGIQRRYIQDLATTNTSAPNIVMMKQMNYQQDTVTPAIDRIMVILAGGAKQMYTEQDNYFQEWLSAEHFSHLTFKKEIGPYSRWVERMTNTVAPSQYVVEEWVKG